MKLILQILLLSGVFFVTVPAGAVSLKWDAVTLDIEGNPLTLGNEVTEYRIYRCQSNSCSLTNGALVGSVPAPTVRFNIDSQPKPSTYFVTAINVSGESLESNTARVTPADRPKLTVEAN